MNSQHRSAIIGLIVAIAAVSGIYLVMPGTTLAPSEEITLDQKNQKPEEASTTASETSTAGTSAGAAPKTTKSAAQAPKPVTQGGAYEIYTANALGYAALGEVVLFFFSPSCPACVLLDKDIITNAARIPKDVKILKVDYDTAVDLKTKYGVTEPHKLIQVNSAGNRITQWSLSSTLSDLLTRVVRY